MDHSILMLLNRDDYEQGESAGGKNLDGSSIGFKVTGDAAMFEDSNDFAMFSDEGDVLVRQMVEELRAVVRDGAVEEVAYQTGTRLINEISEKGHGEVHDTMVRETIAYALDGVWEATYGQRVDQWKLVGY